MPSVISIGTALPEHVLEQHDVKQFARDMFGEAFGGDIDRLIGLYDNTEIERRHFCVPMEWFASAKSFTEKNDLYIAQGLELSCRAIERCLGAAGVAHEEIDYIVFVSTTGLATPSMDARLMEQLPFRRTIKRLPIWGLGCAGGASSLARAMDITTAYPTATVLVVVVELCGLTFIRNDLTKSALIASSLFADGAAAVLVAGDEAPTARHRERHHPRLVASFTSTMPDSLDVMGWEIGEWGFQVLISRDIPTIVRTFMRESIENFLAGQELALDDIVHFVAHPGGAKVLQAYMDSLDVAPEKLDHTRSVLRRCGNISAASVLFVLEEFMQELAAQGSMSELGARSRDGAEREHGLLCALGPGFSAEIVLLQWEH